MKIIHNISAFKLEMAKSGRKQQIPSTPRLRKDCHKFKAILGYIVREPKLNAGCYFCFHSPSVSAPDMLDHAWGAGSMEAGNLSGRTLVHDMM